MNWRALIGVGMVIAAIVWRKPIIGAASSAFKTISQSGAEFIARWEGFEPEAYRDIAGVWTIGYGHTGPDVGAGMRVTRAQALALLKQDATKAVRAVNSLVRAPLKQNQFDALVSLVYNIGENNFATSTTLRELNAGNYAKAAEAIELFNKATIGGRLQYVQGLANRRAAEKEKFLA